MYSRLTLAPADGSKLPEILPGQFVQVAAETPGVFLRRPISINDVDYDKNTIDLLIRKAGTGTAALLSLKENDTVNILLPLGNGFSTTAEPASRLMLIGGGVGVAPLALSWKKTKGDRTLRRVSARSSFRSRHTRNGAIRGSGTRTYLHRGWLPGRKGTCHTALGS